MFCIIIHNNWIDQGLGVILEHYFSEFKGWKAIILEARKLGKATNIGRLFHKNFKRQQAFKALKDKNLYRNDFENNIS